VARGDPVLLRFAIENLLHNAWKFTRPVAEPRVEMGLGEDAEGQPAFFVRDNGIGFPQESAERLFRAFERLPAASSFEGTGVGLASVARIVERHNGRVWATGEPGEGATFWFTLPGAARRAARS
jgi:signal transduction histidine kinase